ncbi:hypothetical protein L7F22_063697 [Adiantum nelumboides]|nr:hypothetical protein [Adiantum nelumboides]
MVGSSTYTRHRKMSERYNNLWCSVSGETLNLNGTSLNAVLREVVTPSNPSVEVTSSNPSLRDEITPSDSSLENDTVSREPSCDELNEDFVAEDMLNQETNQNLFSIYDRITEVIIELQTLCDENQASKAFQDRMLRILFGGMGGSRVGKDDTQEEKASLSKLLVQLPSTWEGSLGDVFVPACWDQLNAMFTTLGMVESSRYRVCQGSQDNMHSPILYPPSLEDNYSGNVVRCKSNAIQKATRKLKRDCKECCEKCTVCGISRKQMMCFDYISIEHQLKCLTRSQSICHEFLEMRRNKKRWLDNSCISEDTKIHEFWDGTKCKNFEDFWNPNSHFELPVICPNSECKQAYRAWPTPDNALQAGSTKYKILCKSCREEFECDKVLCKASTFPMPIIDEEEEQKKDHMEVLTFIDGQVFDGHQSFEGLQQYKDEDDDNLDHDLEISYTELLQNGLSKRVQATKELSPRDETPMLESYEEMVCPRKSGRKRKLSEKMKKYCEVDNAHIKESNASGEVTKRSKEKSNDIEVDVNTLSHEDMETIVLVYSKKKTIMDMYFCLLKMYIGLKKEESSFRSYSKESKSPDSETMIKQVVMWLLHMEKVIVYGCSPISVKDIQIVG